MAVLLLRNRKRTDELCRREGLDGRAHKSGAVTRDDKVHSGTLGHRTDTAVLKVRLIGIGGGKTSFLVERLYRVALKTVAHYLAGARLVCLFSENVVRVLERAGRNNTLVSPTSTSPLIVCAAACSSRPGSTQSSRKLVSRNALIGSAPSRRAFHLQPSSYRAAFPLAC